GVCQSDAERCLAVDTDLNAAAGTRTHSIGCQVSNEYQVAATGTVVKNGERIAGSGAIGTEWVDTNGVGIYKQFPPSSQGDGPAVTAYRSRRAARSGDYEFMR